MLFPLNIFANADDFGYSNSVNKAILFCFEKEYINSATLLTNTDGFDQAVEMARGNACVRNIGVHINLAEGLPLTNVGPGFLNDRGQWDLSKTGKVLNFFTAAEKRALMGEINAQINRASGCGISITHFDSHYHLHTLPGLSALFLQAAKHFKLKLRLAQSYREGSYLKFWYRQYINNRIANNNLNYTDEFGSVAYLLERRQHLPANKTIEVMLHPDFDAAGHLTDHYDKATMVNWLNYLRQPQRR